MRTRSSRPQRKDAPGRNPTPDEIRRHREAASLTQREAAALVYGTLRSWEDWEGGRRRMHPAIWAWFRSAVFERGNPHLAKL